MAITIMCPNLRCRKVLAVPEAARGTRVRCAYCHQTLMIPSMKAGVLSNRNAFPSAAGGEAKVEKAEKGKKK